MAKKMTTKDIVLVGVLSAILIVQEIVLSFLPNIQLTVFLLILYTKALGRGKTMIIVVIHVLLDNLFWGSFNLYTVPFMLVGWLIIPLTLGTIFKKAKTPFMLAILGAIYALIYSWIFIIPNSLILETPFWAYLLADIPFELLLAGSSFLTTLWLYEPLKKVFIMLDEKRTS